MSIGRIRARNGTWRATLFRFGCLGFGLGPLACAAAPVAPSAAMSGTPSVESHAASPAWTGDPPTELLARWIVLPERTEPTVVLPYDHGRTAFIVDGLRVVEEPDGALERSQDFLPGTNTDALPLPAQLGEGFLFHSDVESETALWRSSSWTGRLQPVARLPERAAAVTVGFGRVFARLADSGETVAIDLNSGKPTSLGPLPATPSFFDLLFWDDWFALAHTDVRGVLATFDAGATWHATGLSEESATFELHNDGILVLSGPSKSLLKPDGTWTVLDGTLDADPFADLLQSKLGLDLPPAQASSEAPHPLGRRPLETAVLHGWPLDETWAVLATQGAVGTVELSSGRLGNVQRHAYPGFQPCSAVKLGHGVGFICPLTDGGTGVYQLRADLSLMLLAELPSGQQVRSSGNGHLVVAGPCPNAALTAPRKHGSTKKQAYCAIRGVVHGKPDVGQFSVAGDLGSERVVSLNDGRVMVLVPPRLGNSGSLTLLNGPAKKTAQLRFADPVGKKMRALVESGFWLEDPTQIGPDTIGTWVAGANRLVGVTLNLNGVISVSTRGEADLRRTYLNGRRAVELSAGETAWQTLDYGKTWAQVDAPRGLTAPTERSHSPLGCSEAGCSLGDWLRVGYAIADTPSTARAAANGPTAPDDAIVPGNAARSPNDVPQESPIPEKTGLHPTAYSNWNLNCYPTGQTSTARSASAEAVYTTGQQRPRSALTTGFLSAPTGATLPGADVASSANRPFLGVPRPSVSQDNFAFDMGSDGTYQFRSYTWGQDGEAWPKSAAWVTRVADRFVVDGLWSTAPTRAPWPNVLATAQQFGADRANRYASSWQLSLDPNERGGALRITNTGTTELHFIEEGRATISVGNVTLGPISGAAKVGGVWYVGSVEGSRFQLFQLLQGNLALIGDYPISDAVHASLIRDTAATQLALLLRAPAGTWHIYPISSEGVAQEPLFVDRTQLNQVWPYCQDDTPGWLVVSSLPLSRFTPSDGSGVLNFTGKEDQWKAEAVTARTVVGTAHACVQALAARLATTESPHPFVRATPPVADSVPLTLTDRLRDIRYGFQCAP